MVMYIISVQFNFLRFSYGARFNLLLRMLAVGFQHTGVKACPRASFLQGDDIGNWCYATARAVSGLSMQPWLWILQTAMDI